MITYTTTVAAVCACATTEIQGTVIVRVTQKMAPPPAREPTIGYAVCHLCGGNVNIPVKQR